MEDKEIRGERQRGLRAYSFMCQSKQLVSGTEKILSKNLLIISNCFKFSDEEANP